ncbi:MAG: NAD(P)-dependent alcohol dehydrogenase [Chloroflexota bacterium]
MQAVICTQYGAPDVLQLQTVEKPVPAPNEVLIKVRAATATTAGLAGRKGRPLFARLFSGLTKPKKNILGSELAGEVVAAGRDVTEFEIGDHIFGTTAASLGAHAEYVALSKDLALTHKPSNLNFVEAAAVVEGGLTAVHFLKNKVTIQPGQNVLINGASGAVGTAAVQIAKLFGATVTGVCSGANVDMVRRLGADEVIDYTKEDFVENGRYYDIIFDTVGKRSYSQCKESLTPNGIYLDAGSAMTLFPMLWTSLFGRKKAILATTYVRPASEIKKDLIYLKALVEADQFKPVIDRCYPLAETANAHRYVETERKKGNVIITVVEG